MARSKRIIRADITSANSILFLVHGSDPPFPVAEWNLKTMRTQIFLVGYDRDTGFAGALHAVPPEKAGEARSIAGMPPDAAGDWPLFPMDAHRIASLNGTVIDTEVMEFCLEPHQDAEPAGTEANAAEQVINPK
jgi:hypothetical protein